MRAWPDVESLAEDMKISSRTGYRWLKDGRIIRRRAEGGGFTFILKEATDNVNDNDTDMSIVSPTDANDISEGIPDREVVSRPSRHRTHSHLPRQIARVSPMLLAEREKAEMAELKLKQAKIKNEFDRVTVGEQSGRETQRRERWLQGWISFGLNFLDEDIDLETKIGVKKVVSNLLRDVSVDEDSEAVRLMIQRKILPLAEKYNERFLPEMKGALIDFIMERIRIPYLLPSEKKEIEHAVQESLSKYLVGDEDPDEQVELIQNWVNEMAEAM